MIRKSRLLAENPATLFLAITGHVVAVMAATLTLAYTLQEGGLNVLANATVMVGAVVLLAGLFVIGLMAGG